MSQPTLHLLMPTDVFPPRCGGAGWSAHALATALQARGHRVTAVVPRQGARGVEHGDVLGVPTIRYGYPVPPLPLLKNYARHEWLWPDLANLLVAEAHGQRARLLIHAQHVQTAPAAVLAARRLGAPIVITVRDHWPWDYFATGLHGDQLPYPTQTWASLATDLVARRGPLAGALALPFVPAMLAHLRRRQHFLAQADAVVAVSHYIAARLDRIVPRERIHVIPNMVDCTSIERTIAAPFEGMLPHAPVLLFVGKLEHNKGAHLLPAIFSALAAHMRLDELPELVIAGNGPLRPALERDLASLGIRARFLDWVDHNDVLRLMARCVLLLFPSAWGEPLSRVPLEACACGAPILAMPTGGTTDIISNGVNGALEPTPERFAARMAELLAHPERRRALAAGARRVARERFDAPRVVQRFEELYWSLIGAPIEIVGSS